MYTAITFLEKGAHDMPIEDAGYRCKTGRPEHGGVYAGSAIAAWRTTDEIDLTHDVECIRNKGN